MLAVYGITGRDLYMLQLDIGIVGKVQFFFLYACCSVPSMHKYTPFRATLHL